MVTQHQPRPQPEPPKKDIQTVPLYVLIDRVAARTHLSRAEVTKVIHELLEKGGKHHGSIH